MLKRVRMAAIRMRTRILMESIAIAGFHGCLRRVVRFAASLAFAAALAGCATTSIQQTEGQAGRTGIMLPPATLGESISLQQHLRVEQEGRSDEIDVALETDAQRLDLVGLSMGHRVLSLHYDGKNLQSWRHAMLPAQVRAEDVIEDLQLAFWPLDVIRQALPSGWRVEESGLSRTFFSADRKVIEIVYSGQPRWIGIISLKNLHYNYHLTIQSVSIAS